MVALMGLVASTLGKVPPARGWTVKSPENVTIVPVFTLMHGWSYLSPTDAPPKLMVTVVFVVSSVAVVALHGTALLVVLLLLVVVWPPPPLEVPWVLPPVVLLLHATAKSPATQGIA